MSTIRRNSPRKAKIIYYNRAIKPESLSAEYSCVIYTLKPGEIQEVNNKEKKITGNNRKTRKRSLGIKRIMNSAKLKKAKQH